MSDKSLELLNKVYKEHNDLFQSSFHGLLWNVLVKGMTDGKVCCFTTTFTEDGQVLGIAYANQYGYRPTLVYLKPGLKSEGPEGKSVRDAIADINLQVFGIDSKTAVLIVASSMNKPPEPEVVEKIPNLFTYLDCSTVHFTLQDNDHLQDISDYAEEDAKTPAHLEGNPLIVRHHPYGFWVHVPQEEEEQQAIQECKEISDSLKQVFLKAQRLGAYWINFDRDAEVHDDLPENDWTEGIEGPDPETKVFSAMQGGTDGG